MSQTLPRRFALLALLSVMGTVLEVDALPTGAPTGACTDLSPQHFVPATDCGSDCPYTMSLVAIDGAPVSAGAGGTYKCGAVHTREKL